MNTSLVITLPVRFRFHDFEIYHPKLQEAKTIFCNGVPVTLNELWAFMQDPFFQHKEDTIVQISLNDSRMLNAYFTLRMMVQSAPSLREAANVLQSRGMRFTSKDLKAQERVIRRAEEALLKPYIAQRHLDLQRDVLLIPEIRTVLESNEDINFILQQFKDALRVVDAEQEEVSAVTLYGVVFLLQDDAITLSWLERAKSIDPERLALSRMMAYSLNAYLNARLRSQAKASANAVAQAKTNALELLRQENETLRQQYEQDVHTLLAVIEDLQQRMRPRGDCTTTPSSLEGKRILVVGDESHAPQYRAILESKGAIFDFLPGFDKDRVVSSKLDAADGILFITAYSSHLKFYALKASDTCSVLVPQAGLEAFKRAVEELEQKLQTKSSANEKMA